MTPEERAAKLAAEILRECDRHDATPIIAAAIREAVKAEREACAIKCEEMKLGNPKSIAARKYDEACDDIAAAIRARTP